MYQQLERVSGDWTQLHATMKAAFYGQQIYVYKGKSPTSAEPIPDWLRHAAAFCASAAGLGLPSTRFRESRLGVNVNRYTLPTGNWAGLHALGWHADDEPIFGNPAQILSLSISNNRTIPPLSARLRSTDTTLPLTP